MTYKFLVVGIGEGGGRLATAFSEFGYFTCAVNTAAGDLAGLPLPDDRKFLLEISQGGTGKDPSVVKEALLKPEYREELRNFLGMMISQQEDRSLTYVLVCVGGGGGSGSGLTNFVIDVLLELSVPTGVIYTLPGDDEDVMTKMNAVNTFQQLYNEKAVNAAVSPVILVDNAFMNRLGIPVKDFYSVVNKKIAENIHQFNSFSALPSKYFSAVDTLDFGRVLGLGGVCGLGKMKIVNPTDFELTKQLMVESLFVEGLNIESAKGSSVIVVAPEFMLGNEHVSNCIKYIFEYVSKFSGIVFRGVYDNTTSEEFNVYLIFNGMTFPQDRFNRMWNDIRIGRGAVKRKEQRIDEMMFETEEDVMVSQSFQKVKLPTPKPFKVVKCTNCKINPLNKRSMNLYNGTGPIPFHSGYCPMCGGRGVYEYKEKPR